MELLKCSHHYYYRIYSTALKTQWCYNSIVLYEPKAKVTITSPILVVWAPHYPN